MFRNPKNAYFLLVFSMSLGMVTNSCSISKKTTHNTRSLEPTKHIYADISGSNQVINLNGDTLDLRLWVNGRDGAETRIHFDEFRFIRPRLINGNKSKALFLCGLDSVYFSYDSIRVETIRADFNSATMDMIFRDKPENIYLDSLCAVCSDGHTYHVYVKHPLRMEYPEDNKFRCLDLVDPIAVRELFKNCKTDTLRIPYNAFDICQVLSFSHFGSSSTVSVYNQNNELVYRKQIQRGDSMSSRNYLILDRKDIFKIEIVGDETWEKWLIYE